MSLIVATVVLLLLPALTSAVLPIVPNSNSSCSQTCDDLRHSLSPGGVTSIQPLNFYWAQQQSALTPACYTNPTSSSEVSTILLTAKKYGCKLAIRGGGHSDVPGASNINGGVVINLGHLNQIQLDRYQQVAHIGPGNTWGDVYQALDQYNVTIAGGREQSVGVAGLTLGGGISYFSGTRGFACDNVKSYEVVLADGRIVQVSQNSQYRDLYKALKGGGNNFAIVTSFDFDVFSYNSMYGGLRIWNDSPQVESEVVQGFVDFAHNAPQAPHGSLFTSVAFLGVEFAWTAGIYYTLPESRPAIFKPFYSANLTAAQLINTERISTHSNFATELGTTQPSGFRNQFTTATFTVNADLQHRMVQIYKEEVKKAQPKLLVPVGFAPTLAFQPLTTNFLAKQSQHGGNVLGLDVGEAPLMVVGFLWQWSSSLDDAVVLQGIQNVLDRSSAAAKEMGLYNEFIYQNYAAPKQVPLPTYGTQNRAFMRQVSKKYDPEGVFQTLVAGGFKLV